MATFGVLGQFATPSDLFRACERVRDAGYTRWDAHSPFPVHGLEGAMGMRRSHLPWIILVAGLALQAWVHSAAYPLTISGKPHFAWPAYVPITFELGVLGGALAAVFGMLGLSQLPRHHHPLFDAARFARFSDDAFFISIESADPKFDAVATAHLLEGVGASHVELVEEAP
jgi:hypothetical protein